MQWSSWDKCFWIVGIVGHVLLCAILVWRGRWRTFPWFTFLIGEELLQSVLLYFLHTLERDFYSLYFMTYWNLELVDALVRIAVISEFVLSAYNYGSHVRGRIRAEVTAVCLLTVTCGVILHAHDALGGRFSRVEAALQVSNIVDMFTVASFALLLTWMAADRLRLKSHPFIIASGLIGFVLPKVVLRWIAWHHNPNHWRLLEFCLKPTYLICLIAWCIGLWHDFPTQRIGIPAYWLGRFQNLRYKSAAHLPGGIARMKFERHLGRKNPAKPIVTGYQ